jgi:hypothetical protein
MTVPTSSDSVLKLLSEALARRRAQVLAFRNNDEDEDYPAGYTDALDDIAVDLGLAPGNNGEPEASSPNAGHRCLTELGYGPGGKTCSICGGPLELSGQEPQAGYLRANDADDTHAPRLTGPGLSDWNSPEDAVYDNDEPNTEYDKPGQPLATDDRDPMGPASSV